MVTPFQIVAILFALFMIFMTVIMIRKKRFDWKGSVLWFALWGALVLAVLFFQQVSQFSTTYLDVEPQDLFIFVSIFALFAMMFQYHMQFEADRKNIREIVAEIAQRDAKRK